MVKHREGGDPEHAAASRPAAPSTTRSRSSAASPTTSSSSSGRTRSGTSAPASAPEVSLKDFRKDIIIEVYNEAGQLAIAYKVYRCWVSEYQALPDLDANANAVAIQHIKLENEGWERDYARDRAERAVIHRPSGLGCDASTIRSGAASELGGGVRANVPPAAPPPSWRRRWARLLRKQRGFPSATGTPG